MDLRHTVTAAAALLLAAAVQAHDCSGGAEGGMDATGNECSGPGAFVAAAPASAAAKPAVQAARPVAATARPLRTAARTPVLARAPAAQGR